MTATPVVTYEVNEYDDGWRALRWTEWWPPRDGSHEHDDLALDELGRGLCHERAARTACRRNHDYLRACALAAGASIRIVRQVLGESDS